MTPHKTLQTIRGHPHSLLLAIAFAFTLPRLAPGIPMGVDTTSHLYKIMFFYQNLHTNGYIPEWTPDWYAGTRLLALYPPLSYFLTILVALPLQNPILAYKMVGAVFYIITPSTIYLLARELNFNKTASLLAALTFTLTPQIVENLLFYDRFPNILALPLLTLLLITLKKTLEDHSGPGKTLLPSLLFAALILTHHLSALYALIPIALLTLTRSLPTREVKKPILTSSLTLLGGAGISSLWSIPFIIELNRLVENPFYNRNVIDTSFVKVTYFSTHIVTYTFGIAQFILATFALYHYTITLNRKRGLHPPTILLVLLFTGLILFEAGATASQEPIQQLGQITIITGFTTTILWIILNYAKKKQADPGKTFTTLWFLTFLWLGLGGLAIPFSNPYAPPYLKTPIEELWMSLDIQRFWLLLAIPTSLLSGWALHLIYMKSKKIKKTASILTFTLIALIISSGTIKAYYSLTQPINEYLPKHYTTSNTEIPQEIITYFTSNPLQGRILAIRCPFWIYLLPIYTGKPLVDGWYPQGKILKRIVNINDYRINDLEASENEERIPTWRALIEDSDQLGINWIMIGDDNVTLHHMLMKNKDFQKDLTIHYNDNNITIYKSTVTHSLIEPPQKNSRPINFTHTTPDRIRVTLPDSKTYTSITLKESYFPTWKAETDGSQLPIDIPRNTDYNYITLTVKPGIRDVTIYHKYPDKTIYNFISIISIVLLTIPAISCMIKTESRGRKKP